MIQRENKKSSIKQIILRFFCIVVILVFVFLINKIIIEKNNVEMQVRLNNQTMYDLNHQIELEDMKTDELNDKKNTINSNNNIEKIAREQFGFIKSDEIILKPKSR